MEKQKMRNVYAKQLLILEKMKDYDGLSVFNFVAAKMGISENDSIGILSINEMKISDDLCFALSSLLKNCEPSNGDTLLSLLKDLGFLVLSNRYVTTPEKWEETRKILSGAFRGLGIGVDRSK